MAAYLTNTQFLQCYDARRVCQWLSDNDTPIQPSTIGSNAIVTELIIQASRMIDSAAVVGKRYSKIDIATLALDEQEGGYLRRLCADITFGLLAKRRGYSAGEVSAMAPGYVEAMGLLEQLRLGERIFDINNDAEAGLPDVSVLGLNAFGPANSSRFFGCNPTTRRTFGGYFGGGSNGPCGCG